MLVNVFSSFGRILVLKPGEIFETPEGERLAITDKTALKSETYLQHKDIYDVVFEWKDHETIRLKSLREVIDRITEPRYSVKHPDPNEDSGPAGDTILILEGDPEDEDEVEVAIDEETEILSVAPVVRLADSGLALDYSYHLDRNQDQVCREPLGSRLLVFGRPGTGKTGTLIRRLDFKVSRECLAGEEEAIIDQLAESGYPQHAISWRLFTPTVTLKRHLTAPFKKALVPGHQDNVVTWAEYRKEMARNLFGVLQTPSGGKLILSSNLNYLTVTAKTHTERWFDDFNQYQWRYFVNSLKNHAARLAASADQNLASLGNRSREALDQSTPGALARLYLALEPRIPTISGYDSILSKAVMEGTEGIIKAQSERDPNFLVDLTELCEAAPRSSKEPAPGGEESFLAAYALLAKVIREKSSSLALGQSYQPEERKKRVWEFLASRLDERALTPLGVNCLSLSSLRKLNCSSLTFASAYFDSLIESYLAYREAGPEWYVKPGINNLYINELELDIILLAILEASSSLLWQDYLKPGRFPLGPILKAHKKELRNQILVDEAVDFSPVQLKCALNLSHPACGSFYATGDFNQRLTTWGTKSLTDFEWAINGAVEKTLLSNYRVSQPLEELAQLVAPKATQGYAETTDFASSLAFKPVLLPISENLATATAWIADRIREIRRKVGQIPAIGVTMNSETDLGAVAASLTEALTDCQVKAVVYRENEIPEEDSPIHVINLKWLKGLEFEALFLLDLDKLVTSLPDLYRQYLYLAISRAASFFGATCQEGLPEALAYLAPSFGESFE
jgi:hypothetical protein